MAQKLSLAGSGEPHVPISCVTTQPPSAICHCEARVLCRSNLLLAAWGLLRFARNDSLSSYTKMQSNQNAKSKPTGPYPVGFLCLIA
jgi:hypothetical protein